MLSVRSNASSLHLSTIDTQTHTHTPVNIAKIISSLAHPHYNHHQRASALEIIRAGRQYSAQHTRIVRNKGKDVEIDNNRSYGATERIVARPGNKLIRPYSHFLLSFRFDRSDAGTLGEISGREGGLKGFNKTRLVFLVTLAPVCASIAAACAGGIRHTAGVSPTTAQNP